MPWSPSLLHSTGADRGESCWCGTPTLKSFADPDDSHRVKMTPARSRPKIKRHDPLLSIRSDGSCVWSQPSHVKILHANTEISDARVIVTEEDRELQRDPALVH
jgi:hypothetical protein